MVCTGLYLKEVDKVLRVGLKKLIYFKDYYLLPCVMLTAGFAIVIFLLWSIFLRPREQTVLYVAVLDAVLGQEQKEQLIQELYDQFGITDNRQEIIIDDSFYMKEDGLTKLEVYLSNQQIDVLIADKELFRTLSGYGFLQDLKMVLPKQREQELEADFVRAAGYLDREEDGLEDTATGKGEELDYGLFLPPDCKWGMEIAPDLEGSVCGIAEGSKNIENAIAFLCYVHASHVVEIK